MPVDLDGQIRVVVDAPREVHELVRLVKHLASCLYVEDSGGLRYSLRAETHDIVQNSNRFLPDIILVAVDFRP